MRNRLRAYYLLILLIYHIGCARVHVPSSLNINNPNGGKNKRTAVKISIACGKFFNVIIICSIRFNVPSKNIRIVFPRVFSLFFSRPEQTTALKCMYTIWTRNIRTRINNKDVFLFALYRDTI